MRTLFLAMCVMGMAGCSRAQEVKNLSLPVYDHAVEAKNKSCILAEDQISTKVAESKHEVAIYQVICAGYLPNLWRMWIEPAIIPTSATVTGTGTVIGEGDSPLLTSPIPAKKANKAFTLKKNSHGTWIVGRGIIVEIEYVDNDPEAVNLFAGKIADYLNSLGENPEFSEAK